MQSEPSPILFWNWAYSFETNLWCFCHVDLLDQLPRFKISSSDKPFTLALEVEAALVECAVNKFVFIPAEPKMALTPPATVDFLTSWCGLMY